MGFYIATATDWSSHEHELDYASINRDGACFATVLPLKEF